MIRSFCWIEGWAIYHLFNNFSGLEGCFVWDDKHGFGYTKTGELVIVSPKTFVAPNDNLHLNAVGEFSLQVK